jgi:hypothetical protein
VADLLGDALAAGEVTQLDFAPGQVIQGQHAVGFAPAKSGLELHNRVATLGGQALDAGDQQSAALGQVGAAKN